MTTAAIALRDHLTGLGVVLRLRADRLVVDAPPDVFTTALKEQLVANRAEVVALLRGEWDEVVVRAARDAVLARIGARAPAGAFDGDEQLSDLMETVNVAYQLQAHEGVLDALRSLEAYTAARCVEVAS